MPTRLILELAHQHVVSRIGEAAVLRLAVLIERHLHRQHGFIDVIGSNCINRGIGVSEEDLGAVPIVLLQHHKMEPHYTYEMRFLECYAQNKVETKSKA